MERCRDRLGEYTEIEKVMTVVWLFNSHTSYLYEVCPENMYKKSGRLVKALWRDGPGGFPALCSPLNAQIEPERSTKLIVDKAFGVDCLSDRQIFGWHKAFAEGREDVNDENRAGRPSTSSSDDNVKRVRDLLKTDRRLSVRLISETLDITKTIVHEIVPESLGMRKVCAKLMPK
ncbi:hypothetical protein NQ318_011467, partial [Aromia moschata]